MKLLTEIYRDAGLNKEGKAITRNAVRGIIIEQQKLLMIFSEKNGDYKFPGGGVDRGESFERALIREVREESGAEIEKIETGFGKVVEHSIPIEKEYAVFTMTSHYYICRIGKQFVEQQLDEYEENLGFTPCWISIDEALRVNRALLRKNSREILRWTPREIFVLEQIKTELIGKSSSRK